MTVVGIIWQSFTEAEKKLWETEVAPTEGISKDFVIQWQQKIVKNVNELVRMKSDIDKIESSNAKIDHDKLNNSKIDYNELLKKSCSAYFEIYPTKKQKICRND